MVLRSIRTLFRKSSTLWKMNLKRSISFKCDNKTKQLSKYLNLNESEAQYLLLKHPVINKLDETRIKSVLEALCQLGFGQKGLLKEPLLGSILPVTLKFRFQVLKECGVENISTTDLLSYMMIMKQKHIGELKDSKILPASITVEERLTCYLTQSPTSFKVCFNQDVNKMTLYSLRLKIIQKYLEQVLDLSQNEFVKGLLTYPTLKHRPLQAINRTLNILQKQILMTNNKIKSNFYLVHADPENLENILYNLRTIGDIDIKRVITMHPKLASKNYSTLLEIKNILEEYGIGVEAQSKCIQMYTLSPSTIRERLEKAKHTPELNVL